MSTQRNDPLLLVAKVMAFFLMGLTGLVTIILVGVIPLLLFNQADFAQAVAEAGGSSVGSALTASIVLLLIAATVSATAFHFFQLLSRIISTVGEDAPFTLENAGRLSRMGWIALAFQIASFPIGALAAYLHHLVPHEDLIVDFDFSLTGVLLAVILFILARIFRHGAEMREDLEGTV